MLVKNQQITLLVFLLALTIFINFLERQVGESVLVNLGNRNNLWQHYSSKSLKGKLYEIEKNRIMLQSQSSGLSEALASNLGREIERYKKEQSDIQAQAVKYDTLFETTHRKHVNLSIGTAFINFATLLFLLLTLLSFESKLLKIIFLTSYLSGLAFVLYALSFL